MVSNIAQQQHNSSSYTYASNAQVTQKEHNTMIEIHIKNYGLFYATINGEDSKNTEYDEPLLFNGYIILSPYFTNNGYMSYEATNVDCSVIDNRHKPTTEQE